MFFLAAPVGFLANGVLLSGFVRVLKIFVPWNPQDSRD